MSIGIYLLIGAFSGMLAGLLGLGGGIIVVPALAAAFVHLHVVADNHVMQMAIGTSLTTIVITFLSSLRAHLKRQSVRWDLVKRFLPGLLSGVVCGALLAQYLPSTGLRIFFSGFLIFIAVRLFQGQLAEAKPDFPTPALTFAMTGLIGTLAGILGMGGGVLLIPFMIRFQINMRQATGTSVACGVFMGLLASSCFMWLGRSAMLNVPWSTGFVYWPAFLGVALSSILFAPLGTALAYRLPIPVLKRILAVFLLLVAANMLTPVIKGFL
ncbi:MAG: sulfite exporter TauE/SafE family protein [Pseudomonadota bacterium]